MLEFMSLQKRVKKKAIRSQKITKDVHYEPDTLPNLSERKEASSPKSPKSPTVTESWFALTESQSEATKLVQNELDGPKLQKEGPKLEGEVHNEDSGKPKEPVLERYARRHHAPDQIIGDKSNGTTTRRKLKGTCLLAKFELRTIKDGLKK